MKRTMGTILVMAALGAPVGTGAAEVRGGGFAGVIRTDLHIDSGPPDLEVDHFTGVLAGLVLSWRPAENWSLELRPAYGSRGARFLVAGQEVEIRTPFVELPLLASQDLSRGRVRPYLHAGVALAFRTSATADLPTGAQDVSEDFGRTDWSLRFGGGLRGAGRGAPFLEAEYAFGLTDLNEGTGLGSGLGAIRSRGLLLRAGFSVPLRRR